MRQRPVLVLWGALMVVVWGIFVSVLATRGFLSTAGVVSACLAVVVTWWSAELAVGDWRNRPTLPRGLVRFWVFIGAAVLVVLLEIGEVWAVVDWWGVPYRACGPGCVVGPSPWSEGLPALAYMTVLFALGAMFVYLAFRARRRRVATR